MRKYHINENFFDEWSHDMAYVLGLWFADGCITSQDRFLITASDKDKRSLHEVLELMGSNGRLYKHKNCWSLSITSKSIVDKIISLGGKYRKSLDVEFPSVPNEFLSSFVRGYFDGDGSITYRKYKKNMICVSSFTCGSEKFLIGLYSALKNRIENLRGSFIKRKRRNKITIDSVVHEFDSECCELQFSKNDSIRLRNFMYSVGNICLERKKRIFYELGEIKKNVFGFKDYKSAREYSLGLNLSGKNEWEAFVKGKKPVDIPFKPYIVYKNKGWVSWKEWLGYEKPRVRGKSV